MLNESSEAASGYTYSDEDYVWSFELEDQYATIKSVTVAKTATTLIIPSVVYDDSDITKVKPYPVVKIGANSLGAISSIPEKNMVEQIFIPKSVVEIEDSAFVGFVGLKQVVFEDGSNLIKIGNNAFKSCGSKYKDYVPSSGEPTSPTESGLIGIEFPGYGQSINLEIPEGEDTTVTLTGTTPIAVAYAALTDSNGEDVDPYIDSDSQELVGLVSVSAVICEGNTYKVTIVIKSGFYQSAVYQSGYQLRVHGCDDNYGDEVGTVLLTPVASGNAPISGEFPGYGQSINLEIPEGEDTTVTLTGTTPIAVAYAALTDSNGEDVDPYIDSDSQELVGLVSVSAVICEGNTYKVTIVIKSGFYQSAVYQSGYQLRVHGCDDNYGDEVGTVLLTPVASGNAPTPTPEELPEYLQVIIPKSVETIGTNAFEYVAKVTFEEGSVVNYVGDFAFENLKFPVALPSTLTHIGTGAFNPNVDIAMSEGGAFSLDAEGNLTTDEGKTLVAYYGNAETYTFSKEIDHVMGYAFYKNGSIKTVQIPKGIEWEMFPFAKTTALESVTFEEGLTEVPAYLFGLSSLKNLTIPDSVQYIGEKAFYGTNLTEVEFQKDSRISEIGLYAFAYNTALTHVKFNSSAEGYSCVIDEGAFFWCNALNFVEVNDDFIITSIGTGAFAKFGKNATVEAVSFGNQIGKIVIPKEVEYISNGAFGCLTEGNSPSQVEPGAHTMTTSPTFHGSLIATNFEIIFEEGSRVSTIDGYETRGGSFSGMKGLTKIDLSACTNLTKIGDEAFGYRDNHEIELILPEDSSEYWTIGVRAFSSTAGINAISELTIPKNVISVGDQAFYGAVRTLKFESGSVLETIGTNVVYPYNEIPCELDLTNCTNLQVCYMTPGTKYPAGAFEILTSKGMPWTSVATILSDQTVQAFEGGALTISQDVIAINLAAIRGMSSIDCSGNDHFKVENGGLLFGSKLVAVIAGTDEYVIGADSDIETIGSDAFMGSNVSRLSIAKPDVVVEDNILSGCGDIEIIYLTPLADFGALSFTGQTGSIDVLVPSDMRNEYVSFLANVSDVYLGYAVDGVTVYVPLSAGGKAVTVSGMSVTDGTFSANVSVKGYSLCDVTVAVNGSEISCKGDTVSFAVESGKAYKVVLDPKDRSAAEKTLVTFDGNGGTSSGKDIVKVYLPLGMSILSSDVPEFCRDGYLLDGWYTPAGEKYDISSDTSAGLVLTAHWAARAHKAVIDTSAAQVLASGKAVTEVDIIDMSSLTLRAVPYEGYELLDWVYHTVDGEVMTSPASGDLVLDLDGKDVYVTLTYRYSSVSSGLVSETHAGLPTSEELARLVRSWSAGGFVDMGGDKWTGHASVPLIVDNYVYIRAGPALYKVESDTGYIVATAESESTQAYYHQLGYGNGLIVDYFTRNVYDLDLNLLFTLDRSVSGVEFHDGYFYTSGSDLYRFPADAAKATGGVMRLEKVGTFDKPVYASYGFAMSEFVGDYVYRVYADGSERGFTGMNLKTGASAHVAIRDLDFYYLDDGWLSYHDGVLFLSGYTQGLFGAIATTGYDKLAYVAVNGIEFGTPGAYTFNGMKSFTSEFVVSNGVGYICAGGFLYAFDIKDDGTPGNVLGSVPFATSHGSIVVDASYANAGNGYLTYVYMIPYYTSSGTTMVIAECHATADGFVMSRTTSADQECDYNSQAVRAGIDGQMIWYNDSGQIYSYTTPEKNVFYFFVQNGDEAVWYAAYGETAESAFRSLGIVSERDIYSLEPSFTYKASPYASARTYTTAVADVPVAMADRYAWVKLTDGFGNAMSKWQYGGKDADHPLYNYTASHYFAVGGTPVAGTEYVYYDSGVKSTYTFADNIGDRSVIGLTLVTPGKEATLTIKDGDGKVIYSTYGAIGSEIDLPEFEEVGYDFVLKDSEGNAVSILSGDLVCTAEYVARNYSVIYELDGGTNDAANVASFTIESDDILLKDASKDGYTFVGWFSDGAFTQQVTKIDKGTVGDVTLYAKFEINTYHVAYELDSGTNDAANVSDFTVETDDIALNDAVKEGYTFKGWFSDSGFQNQVTKIAKGTVGDITLFAKFEINKYAVIFMNGDSVFAEISVEHGNTITAPADIPQVPEGKVFVRWDGLSADTVALGPMTINAVVENGNKADDGTLTYEVEEQDGSTTTTVVDTSGNTTETNVSSDEGKTVSTETKKDSEGNVTEVSVDTVVRPSGNGQVSDAVIDEIVEKIGDVESENASVNVDKSVTVESSDDKGASASVSSDSVGKLADAGATLLVSAENKTQVSIPADTLKAISDTGASGKVTVSVTPVDVNSLSARQRSVVGNNPVFNLSASVGSAALHNEMKGVTITVPYIATNGTQGLSVWYVDDDGNVTEAKNVSYDAENKTVTFTVDHFSAYVIGYGISGINTADDIPILIGIAVIIVVFTIVMLCAIRRAEKA